MKRHASAHWEGSLKDGKGTVSTESGVLSKQQYSFKTRFEDGKGTNPEELLGAAHAGCFSMALSMILGESDFEAESIDTKASVELTEVEGNFEISAIHFDVRAKVPGADEVALLEAANTAKMNCPVSRALKTDITMDIHLDNG
ncbi:OsmC family protein [Marinobacter sp.]|uniref:OsmC family protein n=1 Tax=Marinobacter sp. TaxID=50741 RepID=UPI00384EAF08